MFVVLFKAYFKVLFIFSHYCARTENIIFNTGMRSDFTV
uniref:Uncharacterized protein n=1 Tax=Anguilla anguilla TaxID=7936 RepID=A0A0E9SX48_ANGAN